MTVTGQTPDGKKRSVDLQHTVKTVEGQEQQQEMWPTPRVSADRTGRHALTKNGHWSAPALAQAVELSSGELPREFQTEEELTPQARRIYEAGRAEQQEMWPSPRATDGSKGGPNMRGSKGDLMLPSAVVQAETSMNSSMTCSGRNGSGQTAAQQEETLQEALWPTPAASNPQDGEGLETWLARREMLKQKKVNGNGCGTPLVMEVLMEEEKQKQLWPTPQAVDASRGPDPTRTDNPRNGRKLGTEVLWTTPQAHDSTPGNAERMGRHGTTHGDRNLNDETVQAEGQKKGSLNPAWVAQLCGLPAGYLNIPGPPAPARRKKTGKSQD